MANGDNGNGYANGSGNGYSVRWQWFMSVSTAIAIILGALLTFFVQGASLSTTVSIDTERVITLERDAQAANERAAVIRADVAAMRSDLREIETQFCSSDHIRNLMHAYDMRLISMLWHEAHPSQTLPTDNSYYPLVCKSGPNN